MNESTEKNCPKLPKILVIGIGGAGNNAINRMTDHSSHSLEHVDFLALNTDLQALYSCQADQLLQIGAELTHGFGAGSDPSIGKASAEESQEEILSALQGYQMAILTCGMGGGTGTGAISVVARLCKENSLLTMAVVTMPFSFEGLVRVSTAQNGVETLKSITDTLLIIPNDKLLSISEKPFYLNDAFLTADKVLRNTISAVTNIIYNQGVINLDYYDLKTILSNKGIGHLGIGTVKETGSILEAVKEAINSPLLDISIKGASHILINSSGPNINLSELNEAICYLSEITSRQANIIWGTVNGPEQENGEIIITLIATGMEESVFVEKEKAACPPFPNSFQPQPENKTVSHAKEIELILPTFFSKRSC